MNEALRDWVGNVDTPSTSSAASPARPYPAMVRDFQAVIGNEVRAQITAKEGGCPIRWSPASAAAPTRSACSIRSSTSPRCA